MNRTLLSACAGVLLALMFIPHNGYKSGRYDRHEGHYQFLLTTRPDGEINAPQLVANSVFAALLAVLIAQVPHSSRRFIKTAIAVVCLISMAGGVTWWASDRIDYARQLEQDASMRRYNMYWLSMRGHAEDEWMEAATCWQYLLQFEEAQKCRREAQKIEDEINDR